MNYLVNVGRGFLMGGADIIPGVSGGTIALILGIYRRLVTAISHFDTELLGDLKRREFKRAAEHVDLVFLLTLGLGIGIGIVSLAGAMHYLLSHDHTRPATLATFFGMILASGLLVGRMVERWSPAAVLLTIAGTAVAFWITGLQSATVEPGYPYIFLCGMIAICAMILPGISGAYILLLMGMYIYVTGAIKGIPRGEFTTENLMTIAVFGAGCTIGILSFSKVLRWLLDHHESLTMATLCGFMLGSLRKIWPFKLDLTPGVHDLKLKQFANQWPQEFDSRFVLVLFLGMVAFAAVLVLDKISGARQTFVISEDTEPRGGASRHV